MYFAGNFFSLSSGRRSLQILLEKLQRPFPRKLGSFGVVAGGGVVMKAVLFAFVHKAFELFIVLF